MDPLSSSTLAASSADPGSVAGAASLLLLKKAIDLQASTSAQLLQALPQPALATSGSVGTQVNTLA